MFSYDTYRFDWTFQAAVAALGRLPANWLDLGCHNATLVKLLLDRGVPEVTGIDVYDPQLQQESTWTYLRHDLDEGEIPLSSGRFEVVSGLEVIEHVTDTDSFLREVFRVLRPGGIVVLTTPNINMMKNRVRVPLGLYPHSLEYRTNISRAALQCAVPS